MRWISVLFVIVLAMLALPAVSAARLNVLVYGGSFDEGSDVTVSGSVMTLTGTAYSGSDDILLKLYEYDEGTTGTLLNTSAASISDSAFQTNPITGITAGTYLAVAVISGANQGNGRAIITIENQKFHEVITDRQTYSPGDNVTLTLSVTQEQNGSLAPVVSEDVILKIRKGDESTEEIMNTDVDGSATLVYNVPSTNSGYGDYVIDVANQPSQAFFSVPFFNIKSAVINSDDVDDLRSNSESVFSGDDVIVARIVASKETSSGGKEPVAGMDITARLIKLSDYSTKKTWLPMDFTEDNGVYTSSNFSLSALTQGENYVLEVEAEKGIIKNDARYFRIQNYDLVFTPIFDENVNVLVAGDTMSYGVNMVDLTTGEGIPVGKYDDVDLITCRDSRGADCSSQVSNLQLEDSDNPDYRKILSFTVGSSGDYMLELKVNTTDYKSVKEIISLYVDDFAVYADTSSVYDIPKKDFSSGANVNLKTFAFLSEMAEANIEQTRVLWVKDSDGADVTEDMFPAGTSRTVSSDAVSAYAPQTSGCYDVGLEITTSNGTAETSTSLCVKKYDIWADPYRCDNNDWSWEFSSEDDACLHLYIVDSWGNQPDPDDVTTKVTQLTNMMTGETFTVSSSSNGTDDSRRPVVQLDLANYPDLSSGFYMASLEVTEKSSGSTEEGSGFFQISNFDVSLVTQSQDTGFQNYQFDSEGGIQIEVSTSYFNGTNIQGANVSLERLVVMSANSFQELSTDNYDVSAIALTDGDGTTSFTLNPASGESWPKGDYLAFVNVNEGGSTQMSQVWYMVRSMDAYAITSRMSAKYSPEETVSFDVSVTDLDYNGIENANVTLLDIYNLDSDSLVSGVAAVSAQTDSWGYASVSFSAPLDPGDYFAIFSATHPTTGDSETVYGWFRVLNGGYVLDATLKYASESVVTPGGNVNYVVTVKDQDGQGVAYRNVTFYKLVNIDEFPHEESEPTILTEGVTDSEGSADVILTAPRTEGHWIPLLNIDGINITDESIVQHFDTKYINLEVFLQDNDSIIQNTFAPLSPVVVNVSLQNPSGGDIDMTSLTLVDYFFPRLRRTNTLGAAITEGFEDYNSLSFTAPEATGNYILHIRSVDGSANRKLISVPFEVGNQFSYSVYLESFEFGISEQIPIQFSVTGGPAKVQLMSVRDTFEGIVVENESSASAPVSDSTIEYSVGPIAAIGDYELELCIFTGSSCNDDSDREFRMVSIESDYFVNAWPDRVSGMYTSEEGATINLELLDSSQTPTAFDSVDVLSVIEQSTGNDVVGSTIATPAGDTVNLEISQPGDYRATIRLEKSGQWYEVDVWFMIEDYRLNVITDDTGFDYGVGIPITFNISGFGNESGKLYIMDEHNNWEVISRYTQNFSLSDGRAQVDINIDEPGWYVATAAIPSLTVSDRKESHYTFSTGAGFEAYLDYASINNQFSPGEDVVLEFDMFVGGPHDGSVNITVDIRNPHNWEIINESIFDSSVGVTSGQGSVNLTDHGLLDGEYVAEIEFSYGGESVYADYWFRIAGRELYIHTTEWNYDVGDSVVINTELYDGGIVQEGVNITIENITRSGEAVNVTYNTKTDTTDSNGEATVSFDLPKESGKYKVEISENDQDLRRFITISTQGYNVWVDKPAEDWDKWAYHVSDEFRLELRVNDKDWNGVENVSVEYTIRDVDDDWNIVTGPVDAGATDVNGYKEVSWTVTQSGNYFMEIDVDDGSFTEGRSFSVVAFDYFSYLRGEVGETTYSDWEIPDFAIVVLIADVMSGDTPVEGALVELVEVRNLMDWSEENATVIQGSAVTNSEGRAKLKIQAEGLSQGSDFIMRYNISSGNETAEGEAWFRIVDYTFNAELTYPQTLNDTTGYITTSKGPGEMAFIIVNYTGSTDNDERVCIDDIRRWDGYRNYVGQCYTITNGSMTINFTTPTESGGYDVIVVLVSGGDGSTMQGEWKEDRWLWFDVSGGAEANWEVNVWSEGGPNAWTGQPKTFRYEMFNRQNWMSNSNISGTCGNINITEIRNSQTWEEEIYDDLNIRFEEQEMCTDPNGNEWPCGPPGGALTFDIPADLEAGEYKAIILCEEQNIQRDVWFRVASFQVSSLMKEIVKMNQNVSFWVKITRKDGTPLSGADVTLNKLRDNWGDRVITEYDLTYQTDANGEVIGNFIAPGQPGEFEIDLTVTDGNQTQRIERWFRIRDLDILVDTGATEFFSGDDVKISVMARDPVTLEPVEGAEVRLNLWAHCFDMGPPMSSSMGSGECEQSTCDTCMATNCAGNETDECRIDQCDTECSDCGGDDPVYSGGCMDMDQTGCGETDGVCQWSGEFNYCMSSEEYTCKSNTDPSTCETNPECIWDTFMQECMFNMGEMHHDDCPPSQYVTKQTNYEGTATFIMTQMQKAEYELDIEIQDPVNWRTSWIHKSFNVRKYNITASTPGDQIKYAPGDTVNVLIGATDNSGVVLNNFTIEAGVEQMMMGKEGDDCMMIWDESACNARENCEWLDEEYGGFCEYLEAMMSEEVMDVAIDNGTAEFNMTIYENVSFTGGAMLWMDIIDSEGRIVDMYDMFLIVQNGDFNVTVENTIVDAGEFLSINVSSSNTSHSISPEVRHIEMQGGMVSMNQLMGGGPDSGNIDWYESETYLSPANPTHFVMSARETKGDYKALATVTTRGKASFGMPDPEYTQGMILASYTVNSSSGECRKDYECNDGNSTTSDKCVWLECVYRNSNDINLSAGECNFNYQCDQDSNPDTVEACFNFQCVYVNTVDCQSDYECDDSINSTVDLCVDYQCENHNSSDLECFSDFDCSDADNSTIDICNAGICTYVNDAYAECTTGAECNDGNSDTVDWCDFSTYSCIHEQDYGDCSFDYDCDDANSSTFDRCTYGWCDNINQADVGCTNDAECQDSNLDTYDYCDWDMLACMHTTDSECTPMNEQTACNDADPATIDRCDWGGCIHIQNSTIDCYSNADCGEGQFCDTWWFECIDPGDGFCWMDQDCGSGEYCMDGWCFSGTMEGLYSWDREEYYNTSGEGGDEMKPGGMGNPGADMVEVALADVSDAGTMMYAHFRTGGFEADFGVGLPRCGGSFSAVPGLTEERFIIYIDTDADATDDNFDTNAEYRAVAKFTGSGMGTEPDDYAVEYNSNGVGSWVDVTQGSETAYVNCWPSFVDMGIDFEHINLDVNDSIRVKYVTEYYDGSWNKVDYLPNSGWLDYTVGGEGGEPGAVCGNGIVEAGENCDGANLTGQSCISRGFDGGSLSCNSCQFNEGSCFNNVTNSTCGNGIVEDGEDCDDNNTLNGDGCDDSCHNEGPSAFFLDKMMLGGPFVMNSTAQFMINITNMGNDTFSKVPMIDEFDTTCLDFATASHTPDFENDTEIGWLDLTATMGYNLTPGLSYLLNTNFTTTCAINDTYNRIDIENPWNSSGVTDIFLFIEILFDIGGGE